MSNKKKSTGLWRGLTSVSASLLAVTVGASAIVDTNAAFINARLGISSYKIVDTSNGEKTDSTYFKSEFSSLDEVIAAKDALAAEIASEGTVLFKNEDTTLPLDTSSDKVTLWGLNSINPTLGGMIGSSVSIDGEAGQKQYDIQTALTEKGFTLNQDMLDLYSSEKVNGTYGRKNGHSLQPSFGTMYENPAAYNVGEAPESIYDEDVLKSADDTVALVVISRDSSEASDYNPNMTSANEEDSYERPLALSDNEKAMIQLAKEHSTKVVVLLNTNNPVEIDELKNDDEIGAILWAGEPGANGFLGVADVISGEVNPSGHIADTYAVNSTSAPAMVNYGVYLYTNNSQAGSDAELTETNKADWYLVESEGIYTGYKYYETRYEDEVLGQGNADTAEGATSGNAWDYAAEVSYPFGYGMSYTSFEQKMGDLNVDADGNITVEVTVTNTGSVAGKEVVELYYNPPYINGGIEKSTANLIAFDKTELLEAGASETVTLSFTAEDMASYDTYNHGCYVLEAGDYIISLQSDSHNVIDSKTYNVAADIVYDESNPRSTDETAAVNQFGFAEGDVTYLSRADGFANYTEATAAPSNRSMSEESKAQYLDNSNYNPEDYNNQNDVMPATGADNGVQLVDLRGLDYEDELWDTLLDELTVDEMSNLIAFGGYQTAAIDSIGKVATTDCDGPVDIYNNFTGVSSIGLPAVVMLAFTWNTDIAQEYGECIASMADEMNVSGWYAPSMNMHRNSFAGRNFEYYSEDGFIAGKLAASVVQGSNKYGVYAYIKHFALNDQETDRWYKNSMWCNEQTIREIYLKPFETAVKEGRATAVMSSYNYIGPVWSGACAPLQQTVLRDEWGFRGMVITDYFLSAGGAMNSDQAIRNGSDLMLTNIDAGTNNLQDTTSATGVLAMRNATHNILYTVVNSRAYDGDNLNSGMPAWEIMMIVIDLVIAALLVLLEVFVVRKGYKKRKETIIVTESEK